MLVEQGFTSTTFPLAKFDDFAEIQFVQLWKKNSNLAKNLAKQWFKEKLCFNPFLHYIWHGRFPNKPMFFGYLPGPSLILNYTSDKWQQEFPISTIQTSLNVNYKCGKIFWFIPSKALKINFEFPRLSSLAGRKSRDI